MDETLRKEPVSSLAPAFRELVLNHLASGEVVVLLLRYAYMAGASASFLVRSPQDFNALMAEAKQRTSITVFFEEGSAPKGSANEPLLREAIKLLSEVYDECQGIHSIRLDSPEPRLRPECHSLAKNEGELREWFARDSTAPALIGMMPFWHPNSSDVVAVYVPDQDGEVRPGAS